MAFVMSEGRLTGLDRPQQPRAGRVDLAAGFSSDYATIYRTQPHVRTVISFLARNIAQIGLHAFERTSDTDRRRLAVDEHPLAALIAKPNPKTTRYRLIDALVNDLGIYDVACWLKVQSDDKTAGLLRLPAGQIAPTGNSWAWPEGVRLSGAKGHTDFPEDQLVIFRGYNPSDARWGLSPMETLRQILAEEFQATLYREQLWRNGARFPGHIERPAGAVWSEPARERFRQDWRGLYTGAGPAAGGTPVLEDGMTFKPGGITPAQAQYLETRKLTREEVAAAFHIPLPMVGILDHATFSNIEEQHKNLYQDTLGPWLTMIEQEIGLQLIPEFEGSQRVYVEFNLAEKMKGSFEEQATSLQTAVGAPWLTRNEARARQNLPQIAGGDDLVTPLNVLIGGQASPQDSGSQNRNASPTRRIKAAPTSREREKANEVLTRFFKRQRAVVLSALGSKAAADWWDAERWDRELGNDLLALSTIITSEVARRAIEKAGGDVEAYDMDRTLAWLKTVTARIAADINATTQDALEAAIEDEDADPADVFELAEGDRSDAAALTLTTALAGFATTEAARQTGGASKTWITGPNARPSHASMDGETVGIDEEFSNGMKWPGDGSDADEVAGCNCSVSFNYP